jgi:lipoprotein-anchoring transpeptidase ErfK/SrfK
VSDYFEYLYKTNPFSPDTDEDGYSDFLEIDNAFNPLSNKPEKLSVRTEINLDKQTMSFFVAGIKWREFKVSTGKPSMPTPTGEFRIISKIENAWSRTYGLWMPFWLGLDRGGIGIHELPVWPGGYREGENHLGQAVSHGCIRLGVGAAQYIYNHLQIGDMVVIKP